MQLTDKQISDALIENVKRSKREVPVYDKFNGFQVQVGTKTIIDGNDLAARVESLADILLQGE